MDSSPPATTPVALGPALVGPAEARGADTLPPAEKRVVVLVGGAQFLTTLGTLRRAPFFAANLPETFPGDVLANVFVDRSSRHFREVLNYLRNGALRTTVSETQTEEVLAEFEYYGMTAASRELFGVMHSHFDQTESVDVLWAQAQEANALGRVQERDKAIFAIVLAAHAASNAPQDVWAIQIDMARAAALYAAATGGAAGWAPPAGAETMAVGDVLLRARVYGRLDDAAYVAALLGWMATMFPARPDPATVLAACVAVPRPADPYGPPGARVRIQVGSHEFSTTERTLRAVPSRLATPPAPTAVDGGVAFFDRDPTHFGTILNYLRDGCLRTYMLNIDMQELLAECEFYGIAPFTDAVRERIANNEKLDAARKRGAFKIDVSGAADPAKV
jgi:hypothetical protein